MSKTVLKVENSCHGLIILANRSVEEIKEAVEYHIMHNKEQDE